MQDSDPDAKPGSGSEAGDLSFWFNRTFKRGVPTVIAVVEADASARERLEATIRLGGYVTQGFETAEQLLEWPKWTRVGYVFSALVLPGMGGVALHRQMADLGNPIPVVLIARPEDPAPGTAIELAGQHMALLREPLDEDKEDVFIAIEVAAGFRQPR